MKVIKIIIPLLACFCLPALADDSKTDAIVLSTQTAVKTSSRVNLRSTGVTLENGDVWVWGYRRQGLQGNGIRNVNSSSEPARVRKFVEDGLSIIQVAAGKYHIIALDENGDVWGWGRNRHRQAAGGASDEHYVTSPVKVLHNKKIVNIYCGDYASYALSATGEVFAWGRGNRGEIGVGNKVSKQKVETVSIPSGKPVFTMGVGTRTAYAIDTGGNIWTWGEVISRKFCPPDKRTCNYVISPQNITSDLKVPAVGITSGQQIKEISGGKGFVTYLSRTGLVYGYGAIRYLADGQFDEDSLDENDDEEWDDDDEDAINRLEDKEDENDDVDDRLDPKRITKEPMSIIGPNSPDIKESVGYSLSCRYRGCFAITRHKSLLTWGQKGSSTIKGILYGKKKTGSVVQRKPNGTLTKVDGGQECIFYWNEDGEVYGVGKGRQRRFSLSDNHIRKWNESRLDFLMDAMHNVYGYDYVLGQTK
ncbi:hypothetical protein [Gilliamella apicola]|uniref:RCC1 domain-containing protein n=1 Tax=Gilliamella apicola TaxID=1196095 RepID=UPI002FEDE86F